jgi:hypothetical protein
LVKLRLQAPIATQSACGDTVVDFESASTVIFGRGLVHPARTAVAAISTVAKARPCQAVVVTG